MKLAQRFKLLVDALTRIKTTIIALLFFRKTSDISDIKHISNFRYHPHKWRDYVDGDLYVKQALKEYPTVFDHFKLVVTSKDFDPDLEHYYINNNAPSNDVFLLAKFAEKLPNILTNSKLDSFGNLVCGGCDAKLSATLPHLDEIKSKFNKIYYEAKDIECNWVQTIPQGLNMGYMLRNGGNHVMLPQINKKKNKTKLIASAFGSKYPHLTKIIPDRSDLKNFTSRCGFMDDMFCEPTEFYENLCNYRFFACPLGNAIQSPKICECIMCETVPVVTDHVAHRELRDLYDLPLLIVNKWTDLTEEFLNDQWGSVYSKINWNDQKNKFLAKNFNKLLFT